MNEPAIDEVPTRRVPGDDEPPAPPLETPTPMPVAVPVAPMPTPLVPVPIATGEVSIISGPRPALPVDVLGRAVESGHVSAKDAAMCRSAAIASGSAARDATAMVALGGKLIRPEQLRRLAAPRDPDDPPTRPTVLVTRKTTRKITTAALAQASKRLQVRAKGSTIKFQAKVGEYYLLEVLGRGGMGRVVKAHRRGLDQVVALKFVDPEDGALTPAVLDSFANEARMAARLDHPHIVRVLDLSLDHGCPYVAFDYVDGGPLSYAIKQGQIEPREAARIAAEIARALAHCHARRLIHRDVKPSNILIHEDGRARLADFGLAAILSADGRAPSGRYGTVNHMSPEQVVGNRLTPSSDVFALGTVLYEMLAGSRLFAGEDHQAIAERVVAGEIPEIPDLDPELDGILRQSLALRPDERHATARAMAERLEKWLAGPADAGASATSAPPKHARGLALLATAATCLLLTALVAIALRLRDRDEQLDAARGQADLVTRGLEDGLARALDAVSTGDDRWAAMRIAERSAHLQKADDERAAAEAAYDTAAPRLAAAARAGALLPGGIARSVRAKASLADLRSRRLHRARMEGDTHSSRRLSAALAALGIVEVDGRGRLELRTFPPEARVSVYALRQDRGRLVKGALLARGVTPLTAHAPAGRVLVEIDEPQCAQASEVVYLGWRDHLVVERVLVPRERKLERFVAVSGGARALGTRWVRTRPLLVGIYEVTAGEYHAFLDATGEWQRAPRTEGRVLWSRGPLPAGWTAARPVSGVSFDDAVAYARWRATELGRPVRLPTADEWEHAARGGDCRAFPWGTRFDSAMCYVKGVGELSPPSKGGLAPGDRSPSGVRDTAGSLREWVDGWYDRPLGQRMVRGGSFRTGAVSPAARAGLHAGATAADVGFRVVVDIER